MERASTAELRAFYAILTFVELFCKDRMCSIWKGHDNSTDDFFLLNMPGVAEVFTHRRYKQVSKYLRCYMPDTDPPRNDPNRDRAFKIRFLVNHMKRVFQQAFECGENVAVDECVIPFRGILGIKQYFQDKPVKWEIKLWMLCNSKTGYCYNFDIYSGRDLDFDDLSNVGTTAAVVCKLCQGIWTSQRNVFTDRYYTSPTLCYYLTNLGLHTCGTVETNRVGFPKELVRKKSEVSQGQYEWYMCHNHNIVATRWADKRPIFFLSTCYKPEYEGCNVIRHDKKGNELTVACTAAVKEYNRHMGVVDMSDKMAKLDKSRRSYHWYMRVDRKMVMLSMVNAFIIFREATGSRNDLRTFILRVIHQLIGTKRFRERKAGRPTSTTAAVDDNSRLVDTSHLPVKGEGKDHVCAVCNEKHKRYNRCNGGNVKYKDNPFKRSKSTMMCRACNVYLCTSTSCHADYHANAKN